MQLNYPVTDNTLLIDGDIVVYRIAHITEEEPPDVAISTLQGYLRNIVYDGFCWDYRVFLTDSEGNFRKSLYPQYKQNRTVKKPKHIQLLREYLITHEKAEVSWGQEADDLLGINQTSTTTIATIDKDLDMVAGYHFNFVKNKHYYITEEEGLLNFYKQLLTGDSVDNIPGIKGIGVKKAAKILQGCTTEEEYKEKVKEAYMKAMPDCEDITGHINLIGQLLYIRRMSGEIWKL